MHWDIGHFGFLNVDYIADHSMCINDLGLEFRQQEIYSFQNINRDWHCYVFQYTLEGSGIFETPDTIYTMSKGKAFFITLPEDNSYYLPEPSNPENYWTLFYINFRGPAVEPFFRRIRELNGPVISIELESPVIQLFFELYEALKNGKKLERYEGSEWLYQFLISLLRHVEFPSDKKRSPHVEASIDWMQTHYAQQLNLEDMSREIGVTFSHLSRQFYKEQGVTPIQYLTYIRLQHAMHLLLNTDITIQKIADECGFSCGNYFAKVFKKVLHTTPAQYRNQHKNT